MKKIIVAISSVFSLLLAGGCAMTPDQTRAPTVVTPQRQSAEMESRDRITATAIVHSVNTDKRELLLKGKGGKLYSVAVSDEVRNLSKVKVGAPVELTYYEAVATGLEKNAKRTAPSRREGVERSASAQKSAEATQYIEMVGDVTAINKETRRVSLQSGQNAVTMKVPAAIDISTLKVGQQVKATYTQEQAISVESANVNKKRKK